MGPLGGTVFSTPSFILLPDGCLILFVMHRQQNQEDRSPINNAFPGSHPDWLCCESILSRLVAGLTDVSVVLMGADGRMLRCSELAANRLGFKSADEVTGKLLTEIMPEDWAGERILWIKKTLELGKTTTMLSIMHGWRMRTTFNPIIAPGHEPVVLITVERISPERFAELRESGDEETLTIGEVNGLGKLDVLSPRELQVLALLGQGHRPKDIADMLHRSVSTIDGHRERIGVKLGVRDQAALMGIARVAALQVDDAERRRIKVNLASSAE